MSGKSVDRREESDNDFILFLNRYKKIIFISVASFISVIIFLIILSSCQSTGGSFDVVIPSRDFNDTVYFSKRGIELDEGSVERWEGVNLHTLEKGNGFLDDEWLGVTNIKFGLTTKNIYTLESFNFDITTDELSTLKVELYYYENSNKIVFDDIDLNVTDNTTSVSINDEFIFGQATATTRELHVSIESIDDELDSNIIQIKNFSFEVSQTIVTPTEPEVNDNSLTIIICIFGSTILVISIVVCVLLLKPKKKEFVKDTSGLYLKYVIVDALDKKSNIQRIKVSSHSLKTNRVSSYMGKISFYKEFKNEVTINSFKIDMVFDKPGTYKILDNEADEVLTEFTVQANVVKPLVFNKEVTVKDKEFTLFFIQKSNDLEFNTAYSNLEIKTTKEIEEHGTNK